MNRRCGCPAFTVYNVGGLPCKGINIALLMVFLLFSYLPGILSADIVEEYTAKSILALNLARFSEWPPEVSAKDKEAVNLCLWGDNSILSAFEMIDKKPVGRKILSLKPLTDGKHLENCHLLYIAQDKTKFAGLFDESYKRHILTIGETEDFLAQGGIVYLEVIDSKITLHVNIGAMEKAGVRISSRVLKLANLYAP